MHKFLGLLFILGLIVVFTTDAHASLLVVKPNGSVQVNVLSAESDISLATPDHTNVEIEKIANENVSDASIVKLGRSNGKVNMEVYGTSGLSSLNVTDYKDNILEIEERPDAQKLEISLLGNNFRIKNKGVTATTSFPITVDSKTADLSITSYTGDKILSIYPHDAIQSALRTKLLTTVVRDNLEIVIEDDKLQYKIQGEKIISLLNFYNYSIPVSTYVSAVTGEIIKIDAPGWLKVINVIFT